MPLSTLGLSSSSFLALVSLTCPNSQTLVHPNDDCRLTFGSFFFFTFSKPSSSEESDPSPVFIHLLMPVAPLLPASSLEDESSAVSE